VSGTARGFAALTQLIEKTVRDQLEALFDQLVVDFALLLDLVRRLELCGKAGFRAGGSGHREAGCVHVIPVIRRLFSCTFSIARSTAQSECCELSTGTKISRYNHYLPSNAARAGQKL